TSSNLYVYDATTLEELGSIHLELDEPCQIVIDETYGILYVHDFWLIKIVAVIDVVADTLIHYITDLPIPGIMPDLQIDEGIHKIYANHDTRIFQIDVSTDSVATIPTITGGIADFAVNPVTHEVFMCGYQNNRLDIVNGITLEHTTIPDIQGWGVGVNYLENKVYICYYNMSEYWDTICIYDRDTGTIAPLELRNDAVNITFNPISNRMYTSSEINSISSIIDGKTDTYFNLPLMYSSRPLICYLTNHVYYQCRDYIAVLDDATQLLEFIPYPVKVENLSKKTSAYQAGADIDFMAVNHIDGMLYFIKNNFVIVIQDTSPLMTRPPIYLGNLGFPQRIHILDPVSKEVVECLNPPGYGFPNLYPLKAHSMVVRPGGGRLYVPSGGMGVDGLTTYAGTGVNAAINYIEVGGNGSVVPALMPDGSKIYMTNSQSDNVNVIDIKNSTVITTIPTGEKPWGVSVTPDGLKVLVSNKGDNSVSVINAASNTVIETISVGEQPWGLTINPSGSKAYVANSGSGTISVIDIESMTVVATVTVESGPHWLSFTPNGKHVFVSNTENNTVSVIDAGTDTLVQNIVVDSNPEGICALPNGSEMYVGTDSTVSVINTSDYSVQSIQIPSVSSLPGSHIKIISLSVPDPTSRFAGRIICNGKAVQNAVVRASQSSVEKGVATTNASGDYSIFNLQSGTYEIDINASGYYPQSLTGQTVDIGRTTILNFNLTSTGIKSQENTIRKYALYQNYPNPFNPITTIRFELPECCLVVLKVYDLLGREVVILADRQYQPGQYSVDFDATGLASGIYFYKLIIGQFHSMKKMVLLD
ncbi:beta-propeller fold lactonase family protein, partial [candidate division KSB1 bacterium]|nr:beta-propeller fold lactonase family protein [candidate division KSB1 bacterium]